MIFSVTRMMEIENELIEGKMSNMGMPSMQGVALVHKVHDKAIIIEKRDNLIRELYRGLT